MPLKSHVIEHFDAYKSAKLLLRLSVITSSVLLLISLGLISLLVALFPLKEVQPMLLTVKDKADQIVKIEPLSRNQKGLTLLMEKAARHYVLLRETFDLQTEAERYQELFQFSDEEVARSFYDLMNPENTDSPLKKRQDEGVKRVVTILSSTSLAPRAPHLFQVEWKSEDLQRGQVIRQETWLSTLTVECREREVSYEDQYLNPLGFTVIHYGIVKKSDQILKTGDKQNG